MSEEIKEEQKKPEVRVFKGRQRPRDERKKGSKKLDLKGSAQLFKEEFYVYWPDPSVDLSEYEDDEGYIDIDTVPEENLIEFTCRYIDPGTFQELLNTPLAYDLPDKKDLTQEEIEEAIRKSIQDRLNNTKTDADIRYEVLLSCIIDPQFESTDQIKQILPATLQIALYDEIMRGAIGENLVARFQKPN